MISARAEAVSRWPTRHRRKMVHAARITAASLTAYALVHALGLSEGLWAVITAIVVTQSSIGGSLKVAFDQFVGSVLGAAYATAVALALSPADPVTSAIALVLGLAPPALLAAFSAGFRVAPITAAIMLLGGSGLGLGPLDLAASRIIEVSIGCGVGLVVSVLIAPARASRSVVDTTRQTTALMAAQLQALASGSTAAQADLGSLAISIRENLIRLAILVEEAARERRTWLTDIPDTGRLLRTLRRLRHDIDMLRRTAREAGSDALHPLAAEAWGRAAASGAATLRAAGRMLAEQTVPEDVDTLAPAVRDYRAALDEMRRAGVTQALSTAALGRLFGIGFALEQFRRDLDDLVELSAEIAGTRRR